MNYYLEQILNLYDNHEFLINCALGKIINIDLVAQDIFEMAIAVTIISDQYEVFMEIVYNRTFDINKPFFDGMTLLHYAVLNGNILFINFLLDHGANILQTDDLNQTPLDMMIYNNPNEEIFYALTTGRLLERVAAKDFAAATYILQNKANVNIKNVIGNTALHIAIINSDINMIQLLLSHNIDVNICNNNGNTPLHFMLILNRSINEITLLLKYGADPNIKDFRHGYAAIEYAILGDDLAAIKLLIKHNASVDNINNFGSPLHEAVKSGKMRLVSAILPRVQRVNSVDIHGNTALHVAASLGYNTIITKLLKAGAYINARNRNNINPIFLAANNRLMDTYKLLLEHGADADQAANNGVKPKDILRSIIKGKNKELLNSVDGPLDKITNIINAGANINAVDENGNSCLHLAVLHGRCDLIKFLITNGVNVNVVNNDGETPLHLAETKEVLLELFAINGININIPDMRGNTSITQAAISKNRYKYNVLWAFITKESCIPNRDGFTFAHYVVLNDWAGEYRDIYNSPYFKLLWINNINNITTLDLALEQELKHILAVHK